MLPTNVLIILVIFDQELLNFVGGILLHLWALQGRGGGLVPCTISSRAILVANIRLNRRSTAANMHKISFSGGGGRGHSAP